MKIKECIRKFREIVERFKAEIGYIRKFHLTEQFHSSHPNGNIMAQVKTYQDHLKLTGISCQDANCNSGEAAEFHRWENL